MSAGNERFNADARTWDTNPDVLRASALAHKAYLSHLPPPDVIASYDVLEIGCGTGLLSLALAPAVRSITAVDAAEGMIEALNLKLGSTHQLSAANVLPVCALLIDPDDSRVQIDPLTRQPVTGRRFDLVVSHLVLHHIPDLASLFDTIYGCLKPGGVVMVTDFENFGPDARQFHPEDKMNGVERHGIDRDEMRGLLAGAGFIDATVETAFEMDKMVETAPGSGIKERNMVFPFLICKGTKP